MQYLISLLTQAFYSLACVERECEEGRDCACFQGMDEMVW